MYWYVILITCLQATACAITGVPEDIRALVDHYASPEVCDAFVARGEKLAQEYNNPAVIDRYVHADQHRRQEYLAWYNSPLWGADNPGGRTPCKGDLAFTLAAATAWSGEVIFHRHLHAFFTRTYAEALTENTDASSFRTYKSRKHWPQLVFIAAGYALASLAVSQATTHFYLDAWMLQEERTWGNGVLHMLPTEVRQYMVAAVTPQRWFETLASVLNFFGCMPAWGHGATMSLAKTLTANLLSIVYYEDTYVASAWSKQRQYLADAEEAERMAILATPESRQAFAQYASAVPLTLWLETKLWVGGATHTAINALISAIGLFNVYHKLKTAYERTQQCQQEPSSASVPA